MASPRISEVQLVTRKNFKSKGGITRARRTISGGGKDEETRACRENLRRKRLKRQFGNVEVMNIGRKRKERTAAQTHPGGDGDNFQ